MSRARVVVFTSSLFLCWTWDARTPFGTLWTRNITPDRDTGIGGWSGAAVARAIRSGVTAEGRQLQRQDMIWNHASNWDEEDVRSIVSYLRRIPAVPHAIPPTRPPSPDDCEIYYVLGD